MRKVLHVGPCNAPGGMATVMKTLAEHPPDGWEAELLATYSSGGVWSKWKAYRSARRWLKRRLSKPSSVDVVHFHVASGWSWHRKARLVQQAHRHSMTVIIHLHSGALASYLDSHPRHQARFHRLTRPASTVTVVLNHYWKDRFTPHAKTVDVVPNPMPANVNTQHEGREDEHLLLLGRPDPIKGHDFAVDLVSVLRQTRPQLRLSMTGVERVDADGVEALGWVSEKEKERLLKTCSALLVPSAYEGQPMVIIEALGSGCPVVASSNVPTPPETVVIAPYGDQAAWVEAVLDVIDRPLSPERLALSVDEHRIEFVQRSWADIYDQVLANRVSDS